MVDSTMSDADKIRQKRLAKLGGAPSAAPTQAGDPSAESNLTPATSSTPIPQASQEASKQSPPANGTANPFTQLGMKQEQEAEKKAAPQIKIRPRPDAPRPRSRTRETESLEVWQDRNMRAVFRVTLQPEDVKDSHGHQLAFLTSTRDDLEESSQPLLLNTEILEGAITEAASKAPRGKPFEYLLSCFKRVSRGLREGRFSGDVDAKRTILKEAQRLCMSYCIFAVTMPEMFGENVSPVNPLVDHLLQEPESDFGICTDFLTEAKNRMEEEDGMKEALIGAAEELSRQLASLDLNGNYRNHVVALRNLVRFKEIAAVITESPMFAPKHVAAQDIETQTLLGPFFRLSPMQLEVAKNYFSSPKTRDRNFIASAQNALRMTLREHQDQLAMLAEVIVKSSPAARERMLDWFALCVNKNQKKRAMRVDYKTVSSDGFMLNVTNVLDRLCDPFMDAQFGKIDRIDANYLRRQPRVDISEETKINADQKTADAFYGQEVEGTNNFISEVFFLTVASHHYGTEAAQERLQIMRKSVKRLEQDLASMEGDREKFASDPRYLARYEQALAKYKEQVDDTWSLIHSTYGVLCDDVSQARSMQFMRYVIVWILRLASGQNVPQQALQLPLPEEQPDVFKCLPEYFLEDIVDNFKFIVGNIPHIITPQQSEEIVQVCVTFLRNTEYVKNPGVKSGLVTILYYGVQPYSRNSSRGLLGDLLISSPFAHKHLLHALMKFYIEAESTGTHTQFYDKFNIRYEIFQVIKCIWVNTMYRENLAKEARINTDFFVRFVNMIVNDVTFVLDESLTAFTKINELTTEVNSPSFAALDEDQKKEKTELLEDQKGKAKSYMSLTRESMETLILFTEALPEAFTMVEVVNRLAAMLDSNLNILVGDKRANLIIVNPQEYKFDPKALLQDIVKVFINLSGRDLFVNAIATDGRSYKPENFHSAAKLMTEKVYMAPEEINAWNNLGQKVAEHAANLAQEEEDLGEPPDEFLDPLMADLMTDPVILPSSKTTIDRGTIKSHLLSDATDPFNRAPLKLEDVIEDAEMKRRINEWRQERLAARRAEKEAAAAAADAGGGEAMDTSQ
ncbi:Ubiquitin conjugation factor E4 [Recurvomyces mirabilis]|uniref:Ubiquitin conjugation factor E4 n=1 Tax=Recurvomyces mirabilis TaxID=574656 RepID=A0AAE0WL80_9PEZI|nr:Ubiquitin conjugation factor E4 [Recurvomyces mirabilis]KAK5152192.1 Ubiquitin conjugation factor E4 [Recurvomyces mirabilis]